MASRRAVQIAIAAAGIGFCAAACGSSHQGSSQPSGAGGTAVGGTWTIASCAVDVSYIDDTNTVQYYLPDTDANFQQYYTPNKASGVADMAVVVTLVNSTGGGASLPTGLVVSFTDASGNSVGSPQTFNNTNGTGYGAAITNGHGSGEAFSASTLFSQGARVAESPDIGASVPAQPDLSCSVRRGR